MNNAPTFLQTVGRFTFRCVGGVVIRLWGSTISLSGIEKLVNPPCIYLFWHDSLLFIPYFLRNIVKVAALVSRHHDGELIAIILSKLGYKNVRGSDTEGGTQAIRELLKLLNQGYSLIATPDGPKGPSYIVKPGVVFLAKKTNTPLVMVNIQYENEWRLKTWDRLRIPKPFTKAKISFSEPFYPFGKKSIEENRKFFMKSIGIELK